jgi:hypothetical protein
MPHSERRRRGVNHFKEYEAYRKADVPDFYEIKVRSTERLPRDGYLVLGPNAIKVASVEIAGNLVIMRFRIDSSDVIWSDTKHYDD